MIFAAGLGTRLRPLTNDRPKALVAYGGKTLLQRVIERMKEVGVERLVINVCHYADQIIDFLREHDNFQLDIQVSDERDLLLDTGGGLRKAREWFLPGQPVLIHNVDILTDVNLGTLIRQYERQAAYAMLVIKRSEADRVLRFDAAGILRGWENRITGEQKIVNTGFHEAEAFHYCGIQILSPAYWQNMILSGVFSIIDEHLAQAKYHSISSFLHEGVCLDLGTPEAIQQAAAHFAR